MDTRSCNRVQNPHKGFSFGLEYPFLFREEGEEFVVYRRVNGEIVERFSMGRAHFRHQSTDGERRFLARQAAYDACMRLNKLGRPGGADFADWDRIP